MSDYDFINDHMGGHDKDGLPNFLNEIGKGGTDGFGDVDYAFYHSDRRGILTILYALRMTLKAVELLPYHLSDKAPWEDKGDPKHQDSELVVGITDGWQEIYDTFKMALDGHATISEDFFIFIHPVKEILEVTHFREKQEPHDHKVAVAKLHIKPNPQSKEEELWGIGLFSSLCDFNEILEHRSSLNYSVRRLTREQSDDYLAHKIAIRDIHIELKYLRSTAEKESATRDKLIKDKLVELVTETASFSSIVRRAEMDKMKILVEISTKENPMPTFEIEPDACGWYHLYEVNLKGDILSVHWITDKTLKEKYSLVNGAYSVPLLDLIKSSKERNNL